MRVNISGLVGTYSGSGIKTWFMERPVPDFEWVSTRDLWNSTAHADAMWAEVVENISKVYPRVQGLGFSGLVYDNEGYYSGTTKRNGVSHQLLPTFATAMCHFCQRLQQLCATAKKEP